jgi:hypothetical protein
MSHSAAGMARTKPIAAIINYSARPSRQSSLSVKFFMPSDCIPSSPEEICHV